MFVLKSNDVSHSAIVTLVIYNLLLHVKMASVKGAYYFWCLIIVFEMKTVKKQKKMCVTASLRDTLK